jgi:hypothetical protein
MITPGGIKGIINSKPSFISTKTDSNCMNLEVVIIRKFPASFSTVYGRASSI